MKLETFFEKFDQFADAPDAVAKMRELILESAIRGKLVPQDRRDEPASELLKRVASMQDGQSKKRAALPPVGDDTYLELPTGWEWTRLGNTGRIFNGDSVSEIGKVELAKVAEGLPFIATKDIGYGREVLAYDNGLKVPLNDPRFKVAQANAVLICAEGGSAGRKIGITDRDICFGNKLYANEVSAGIHHRYVFYVYQAPTFFREFAARMTGIIGGIARSEFLSLPIPLPPENEQKRIVAKVDELMALCDRLESQQQERETRHAVLARASLARFADAPTPANLPFLFHPSYAIPPADLRKSILTLAVQGKLVPQDPNDEDASHQLEAIQARKAELVRKQVIKKSDPSRAVDPDEVDHDIPDSWAWVRLVEICELITDGTHLTPKYTESGRMFLSAQNVKPFKFMPAKHRFVSEEHYQGYVKSRKPEKGDVLLTRVGAGIGEAATIDQDLDFAIYVSLGLVRPVRGFVFSDYITLWLNSPDGTEKSSRNTYGKGVSQGNLNLSLIRNFLVPLPPLAEQRRIVAKVEQLMTLVDALETQLAASRATAANLLSALVAELTGTPRNGKVSVPSTSTTGRRGRPPKS